MYDDPPKEDNYVNPYYRKKRTPIFKTDHPELAYKNQGHLMNNSRVENLAAGQNRMYSAWEPPKGGEARNGKKILVDKPKEAVVHQELD